MYDAILCIGKEVQFAWQSPAERSRKISRVLYIYNRYMSLLWNLMSCGAIPAISDIVSSTIPSLDVVV